MNFMLKVEIIWNNSNSADMRIQGDILWCGGYGLDHKDKTDLEEDLIMSISKLFTIDV